MKYYYIVILLLTKAGCVEVYDYYCRNEFQDCSYIEHTAVTHYIQQKYVLFDRTPYDMHCYTTKTEQSYNRNKNGVIVNQLQ